MKRTALATILATMLAAPAAASTVLVGYTFNVSGAEFLKVTAPTKTAVPDPDGYFIEVGGETVPLGSGVELSFSQEFEVTPTSFTLTGIDPALGLDPDDPSAFLVGLKFVNVVDGVSAAVTRTPIVEETTPVPLPASALLMLSGLGGAGLILRRRQRAQHAASA
jgi:hypothetical protein